MTPEWKKLRRQVKRELNRWEPIQEGGSNREKRQIAVAMTSAYGSVLRMMDKLETPA